MNDLLDYMKSVYGIKLSFCEEITKGTLSNNYIVKDEEKRFFLKKYRYDNAGKIIEIHSSKKYFSEGGIPVIMPIPLLDGMTFFNYEKSFFALFPFVEGIHIEGKDLDDKALISMAKMLGRIHLLGRDSKIKNSNYLKIEKKEKLYKVIDDILSKIKEINLPSDFDRLALRNIELQRKLLLASTTTIEELHFENDHLIHGDYLDHNIFFNKNEEVQYVFDFEKVGYAPRTIELFRSMFHAIINIDFSESDLRKMKVYLNAYSSIYPIQKDEIRRGLKLCLLKYIHGFWIAKEHYLCNNNRMDKLLPEHHFKIEYLSNNFDKIMDFLTT